MDRRPEAGVSFMPDGDYEKLLEDTERAVTNGTVAILGAGAIAHALVTDLRGAGFRAPQVYGDASDAGNPLNVTPLPDLARTSYDYLVVAANDEKEEVLQAAQPYIKGAPKILVSGYGHYSFRDAAFHKLLAGLRIPSLANGYPHTLPHLYQCLVNAKRLNLDGVVAEFGVFQGGTTMFLSRVIRHLRATWPIYAFDTFEGFPARRHPWDMYDHEDLYKTNYHDVQQYLKDEDVHLIRGDIVETAAQLKGKPLILTFMDTDNYSPARAALEVVQHATVPGGAIVFDHFTGTDRFRQTLGERFAAQTLLDDPNYFNLHGTGVFLKQR